MDAVVEVEDDFGGTFDEKNNGILTPSFLFRFGWVILLAFGVMLAFVRRYWSHANFVGHTLTISEDELKKREALEASRIRMQERLNAEVERCKAKLEAEKHRTRVEGSESINNTEEGIEQNDVSSKDRNCLKNPKKTSLRANDYSPLMSNYSPSCRYRPSGRFGPRGG